MKKIFRRSVLRRTVGNHVSGFDMYKYGLPYSGAAGTFFAKNEDHVDLMLAALERHPELHVVTNFRDRRAVNRYEKEGAHTYYLHLGNPDPEIEFSNEWSADDFTEEQWKEHYRFFEEFSRSTRERTVEETAAVNWAIAEMAKR